MPFLNRDHFVEDIYSAKFKDAPSGFKKLSEKEIAEIINNPSADNLLAQQEKGVRPSCALPYELYADGRMNAAAGRFDLDLSAGNNVFGKSSAGSPFTVCAPGNFSDETGESEVCRNWSFAVAAGDKIGYSWPLGGFENKRYHLRLNGPNGFYREFTGDPKDPSLDIILEYEKDRKSGKLTGNVLLKFVNENQHGSYVVNIKDNAYKTKPVLKEVVKNSTSNMILNLGKSFGWYDFTLKIKGFDNFEKRYAGRVETGKESFSDPFMGRMI
jgi:phospholipase C